VHWRVVVVVVVVGNGGGHGDNINEHTLNYVKAHPL
jgi:hypothetical protein